MLPGFPGAKVHDGIRVHTKEAPKGGVGCSASSDCEHGGVAQFGATGVFSTSRDMTPLRFAVPSVILRGSKPQVRRVNAGRIIAPVQHPKASRDLSECKAPSYTVGLVLFDHPEDTIPPVVNLAGPDPAVVRIALDYTGPETVVDGWDRLPSSHVAPPECDSVRSRYEPRSSAGFAYFTMKRA